jgi:hypothetical protein
VKQGKGTAASYRKIFRYNGLTVQVLSRDGTDLDWLAEFLSPSFRILQRGSLDYRVTLEIDPRLWEKVRSWGPHPRRKRVDSFFLDTKIVRHPIWKTPGDETVIFDEEFGVFYAIDRSKATVTILGTHEGWLRRLALMRVVRELAMIHSWRGDGAVLHGAGFSLGGRYIVVAGRKHSGKTSVLIHALLEKGARYLANDRCLVNLDSKDARMRGMPTIVTLRPSSLAMFPALDARLRSRNDFPALSLREARRGVLGPIRAWRDGKFTLSPAQLCDLLGVGSEAQGVLSAILFPSITGRPGSMKLQKLSRDRASAKLRANLFRARPALKFGGVFAELAMSKHPTAHTIKRFSQRLASRVPCYVCRLGRDAYREPLSLDLP